MLEEDIDSNRLFVYTVNGRLEAVFAFILGPDPTYRDTAQLYLCDLHASPSLFFLHVYGGRQLLVDMALWDLLGQKYSAPVYRMLGGARSNIVTGWPGRCGRGWRR